MLMESVAPGNGTERPFALQGGFGGIVARNALATGLILASALLFVLNTHQGIGILPDSTRYMRLSPTPYDAPLYTWLLTAMGTLAGRDAGAEIAGLVLVCLNALLIWRLLLKGTGSLVATALGTAVITLSPQYVALHAVAMSEPLFLCSLFSTVLLFLRYRESGRPLWLVLCAVALGLTMLVRFAALPLAAAFSAILLFDRRQPLATRLRELALLGGVSAALFFAWVVISQLTIGHSLGREMMLNGNADAHRWVTGLMTLTIFLLPSQLPWAVRLAFLLVVVAAVAALGVSRARSRPGDDGGTASDAVPTIFGLFALCYVTFMAISVNIEANLNLNARYALPFYIAVAITATSLVSNRSYASRSAKLAKLVVLLCGLTVLASHLVRTPLLTRDQFHEGVGFVSKPWRSSPIVGAVNALPANAAIFSNGPDALNYLTPRTTAFIPARTQRRTGRDNPANSFAHQVEQLRARLARGNTYVVFIDKVDWRFYLASEADLRRALNLRLVRREPDGRIYAAAR